VASTTNTTTTSENPPLGRRNPWRRSLQLRVVTTTLLLGLVIVGLLMGLLLNQVTRGVLSDAQKTALTESAAAIEDAQRLLAAADTGVVSPNSYKLVESVAASLAQRAGDPALFDVLLLPAPGAASGSPQLRTNVVEQTSVPTSLSASVNVDHQRSWTYTSINYFDKASVPGIVVGSPIVIPQVGPYALYLLFPLDRAQRALEVVRSAALLTGFLLLLGIGVVTWVASRQVVRPVKKVAGVAERLRAGQLDERVPVEGTDDIAELALSFNSMAAGLQGQIAQLEHLSHAQQQFVSDVSHELRTPLTTVRMAADVVYDARSSLPAQPERAAELLQQELDRFEELLADLLEISRFDAGVAVLEAEPSDIGSLVSQACAAVQPLAERFDVDLVVDIPTDPIVVVCDGRRIRRVLRNLLVNAIEHGSAKPVDVIVRANDTAVAVAVRDRGVGLTSSQIEHVFTRFWRADPSRARTMGGTGLGLAISLEDAQLHGGWLEATGEPDRGACFRLTLPLQAEAEFAASPITWAEIASVWSTRSSAPAEDNGPAPESEDSGHTRIRSSVLGRQALSKVVGLRPDAAPPPAPSGGEKK
jgi:two-component system, OmpR family, sensor histidine kinase MtrB